VTEQVRAEAEQVRLTEELMRRAREFQPFYALAENAPDGFVLAGMDQRITYANRALKAMVGYGDGLIGQRLADLIVDERGEHLADVRQALFAHGAWQGEASYRHKEGYALPIHVSLLLIRDAAGEPLGSAAVVRDLRAQRQAEQEHTALQEQVIAAQQAALRELSTPLIPLTDNVVVMPLIGTIDSARSQQILEVLLEGIALHQAEAVLLDISGVRVVDTQVADALLRAAKAVRLLGAQVILTGLSAEVAQTIVHLGADLGDIVTQSNLQAGLRYAMERYDSGGSASGARYRSRD
jgi:rsbT co-antagonist protein RsbR